MSRWDEVTSHFEHRVTFSETDGLGYVHHRCAAVWFEQARETFFRRFGVPAVELYKKGWYLALRQLNVRYDSFIGYDDHLSIRGGLTKLGRVAIDFHYRIDNLTITFEPLAKLAPAEEAVFRIRAKGRRAGDQRIQVQLTSADQPAPITKEEITRVYADR